MAREIISLENVYYSYPREKKPALENINLAIAEGEFLAVMGENGAGKTTLCRLFNGIIPHSTGGRLEGNITIDGECTRESSVAKLARRAGMVLDDPDAQLFTSSVRDETAFGPENLLLPVYEVEERVNNALSLTGLAGFEERTPATLSGGEKQRLAIAAALAMAGKILILDEPLSRLDPEGAEELLRVIKDVRKKRTLTVIMAAHESKKVLRFADRICVLKNGRIAACDTPQKIFEDRALPESNGIQPPVEPDISAFFVPQEREMKTEENAAINISDFSYFYANSNISSVKINLSIADNDFAAIIGRNGCGKTTLLKNIAGLLRPSTGAIYIRGKNSDGLSISAISKEVGFVMQNPDSQLFTGTVYDEVSFALKNYRLPKEEIRRRTEAALRTVGLENWDAFPHAMNRGDRTKTVIASVLAMGCRIILLDEPDVGQDYRGSREIMEILRKLRTEGNTLVFVTHNISLACEYAQRLIIMDKSGIVNMRRRGAI